MVNIMDAANTGNHDQDKINKWAKKGLLINPKKAEFMLLCRKRSPSVLLPIIGGQHGLVVKEDSTHAGGLGSLGSWGPVTKQDRHSIGSLNTITPYRQVYNPLTVLYNRNVSSLAQNNRI